MTKGFTSRLYYTFRRQSARGPVIERCLVKTPHSIQQPLDLRRTYFCPSNHHLVMEAEALSEPMDRHPLVSLVSACFWVTREYLSVAIIIARFPCPGSSCSRI